MPHGVELPNAIEDKPGYVSLDGVGGPGVLDCRQLFDCDVS